METEDVNLSTSMNYLCRICLCADARDKELYPLFEKDGFPAYNTISNLSQTITLCTSVRLYPVEGLSSDICKMCRENLDIAEAFRIKCIDSDSYLRRLYPERFTDDDKFNIKQIDSEKNEKHLVNNDVSLNNEPHFNISIVNSSPKRKKIPKISTSKNLELNMVEVKKEKIDSSDNEFFFDNDLKSDSDDYKPIVTKKTGKKFKKKNKKFSVKQSLKNSHPTVDIAMVKEEDITDEMANEDGVLDYVEMECDNDSKKSNKEKMYKCGECGKPLSKKSSLIRHIQTMHNEEKKLTSRKTGHGKDKRFHCPSCPYVTKFSQSLVYHERIHTGERPHKCPHCERSFSQPGSLSCHLKTHSDKTYYTCAECGKQFKHKDSYEVHKLTHNEDREVFTCEICNASLKSRKTLESHINRHNNIKNYSCETCGLRFVTLVELINHSKKHNTEKIYKCNFCDFCTALKRSLQCHTKRHSNYRPFKCQNCDLSCFTKWELKNHEKTHTRESNYTCFLCQRKFIHSSSLNKHMLRTHGVKYSRNEEIDRRKVK